MIILGTLALLAGATALITSQVTPQYESSARLFISTTTRDSGDAYQGSLFSAQRVKSYADLAAGEALAGRVIAERGLRRSPSELSEKITASVVPDTVNLEIVVEAASPTQAQALAQTAAEQLTTFVAELETPPGKKNAPIKATIVDPASLPERPATPNMPRNVALSLVLGLLLGLGAAILRELLDTSVKSPEDVAEIANTAVMGNILFDSGAAKKPLVTSLSSHAPRVEAFRVLRTNLQFVDVDGDSKVFVVTSSVPDEGKTTTTTNLAITLAQAGQRVLLVEADLRRPKITEHLRLEPAVGLTTVLVGRIDLEDAVQDTSVENLSVLTSGSIPPNPAELLQSQAMKDVFAWARLEYDVVLVDAPPLLPVTDAALLTAQSDGALLVVRHGKTTKEQLAGSIKRLDAVEGRTLGVVLNMVPQRRTSGDGYGYGYGYGYGPEGGRHVPEKPRRARRVTTDSAEPTPHRETSPRVEEPRNEEGGSLDDFSFRRG
jgi:capsular exopolysaccharide synthesis family protein